MVCGGHFSFAVRRNYGGWAPLSREGRPDEAGAEIFRIRASSIFFPALSTVASILILGEEPLRGGTGTVASLMIGRGTYGEALAQLLVS